MFNNIKSFFNVTNELTELRNEIESLKELITEKTDFMEKSLEFDRNQLKENVLNIISQEEADKKLVEAQFIPLDIKEFVLHGFVDKTVKRRLAADIRKVYHKRCACCGKRKGLTMDHFFHPKSKGGTFVMKHQDGQLYSNVVLMCSTCNEAKDNMSFEEYVTDKEMMKRILTMNAEVTKMFREVYSGDVRNLD